MKEFRPRLIRGDELTEAGRKGHELVFVDHILRAVEEPGVSFFMSNKLVERYEERKEKLILDLNISQRPLIQERRITQLREELEEKGYPFWRKPEMSSLLRRRIDNEDN